MKTIIIASLLSMSCAASADKTPTPPTPPGPPSTPPAPLCTKGAALFGEAQLPESKQPGDSYAITVYDGGAWERVDHKKDGGEGRANGCLEAAQLATVKAELAKATWKVIVNEIHCMAIGATFTRFSVGGKTVWDQHVCGDGLDEASGKALAAVRAIVDAAAAPHTPPCCKN